MARGPKGFSDEEKAVLRDRLCMECEKKWALLGYKKTNIGELTSAVGISTGAFYLLFPSKEDFFCETLIRVRNRLKETIMTIIHENKNKQGFVTALNWHFQEFERVPFLYDLGSPDFMAFLNKIPRERVDEMTFDSKTFFYEMVEASNLTFKFDSQKCYEVINTLLYTVELKKNTPYDSRWVFEFLLNSVIDDLFD
ncbi:TetR/AcrR family transcriptional regulator [uncultured Enterococcus sp.]|uniref:TetR/AcrR family transcriptional regulator n=1 Tax=uncultured Enterococcus sp. TaxID=167972 RepID=UPI002AA87A15|nr:TetR/AcrR family transcriptional regulator [uncultured Enterococcus sp.]